MDSRRVDLQLALVRATYRRELTRLDAEALDAFRARANEILGDLTAAAGADPESSRRIDALRRELSERD